MCAENVLRLAAIDCSSPMSANTVRKGVIALSASTGISKPACAMSGSSPKAFSATVLPPVFGPEMTSARVGGVIVRFDGTTTCGPVRAAGRVRQQVAHGRNQQRMPHAAQIQPAVFRQARRDAIHAPARAGPWR